MSTIQTEGDGDGIEAPVDVPIPPGYSEDELEQIVSAASEMIERDMRRTPAPAPEPEPEPAVEAETDQTDTEADELPEPDGDGSEGAEAASDSDPAVAAQSESEAVGDPEPAAEAEAEAEPTPAPEPEEPDGWARAGDAWERLYGQRPSFEDLQGLAARAVNYDNLVGQIQQLPAEHQQILGQIIQGTFDPAEYARTHAPATQPRDPSYDPLFDDGNPAPTPQNDEVVRELRELRAMQERQREDEWTRTVREDLTRVQADFLAANPNLTPTDFEQIARNVHAAGTWTNDLPTQGAYGAYGRHLLAHAVAAGYQVNPPGQPATSAPTPAPAPEPGSRPVPADEHPLTAEEQAHAQRRQAAAASVSGSSSPARATKRSVLDVDQPGHPTRPRNGHDLQAELARAAEEMGLGT